MSFRIVLALTVHAGAEVRARLAARGWSLSWTGDVYDEHGDLVDHEEVVHAVLHPPERTFDDADVWEAEDF